MAGCYTQREEGSQAAVLFFLAWGTEAAAVGAMAGLPSGREAFCASRLQAPSSAEEQAGLF